MVWIINHNHGFLWDAIVHICTNFNGSLNKSSAEIKAWMSNYIPL